MILFLGGGYMYRELMAGMYEKVALMYSAQQKGMGSCWTEPIFILRTASFHAEKVDGSYKVGYHVR